jgi:mannose-6-phosphate isomerase-like protein (cupin superfamily)
MSTAAAVKGKHSPPREEIFTRRPMGSSSRFRGDTNQTFEVVEKTAGSSRARLPSRRHFYIFDGSADFQVGDELFLATKGSCVHIPPGVPHQVTSREGVRMLMIYSPAGTEGMFAAMHALAQDQLMNAELTKQIALKHDTVMIEQSSDGRGKGTILG